MFNGIRCPVIENASEIIFEACKEKLYELYGKPSPKEIHTRANDEINTIAKYDNETIYLIAKHLVDQARAVGQPSSVRGGVGSSLIAFLLGITDINPLKPHYRCKGCKHVEFISGAASGFDLPNKPCPHCESTMTGDGHDIPFETFGGLTGDRSPDIDINFPVEFAAKGQSLLEGIFPDDLIVKAGVISEETNQLSQHPSGWMIIPRKYENEIPITYIGKDKNIAVTAQDYNSDELSGCYMQDILGLSALDQLRKLAAETNIPLESIPMNDPRVYQAFCDDDTQDIPEFGLLPEEVIDDEYDSEYVLKMLKMCKPNCFSDLVNVSGLSHGSGVWNDNAKLLLESGDATLQEVIACRDDIFNLLVSKGMERERAFEIMETVRKGIYGGFNPDHVLEMFNICKPNNFPDLVKESGLSHGVDVWLSNAKLLLEADDSKLQEVIASRADIVNMLVSKGMERKWAYRIIHAVRKGSSTYGYLPDEVFDGYNLPEWYAKSCKTIQYLFPKAHAVSYTKIAVQMMWFKLYHREAFDRITADAK